MESRRILDRFTNMDDRGEPVVPWKTSYSVDALMVLLLAIFDAVDLQFLFPMPLTVEGEQLLDLLISPNHVDRRTLVYALLNAKQEDKNALGALFAKVAGCFGWPTSYTKYSNLLKDSKRPPVVCVSAHDGSPLQPVLHVGDSVYKLVSVLSYGVKGNCHQTFQHHCCWYHDDAKGQGPTSKFVKFPKDPPKRLAAQVFVRVDRFVPSTVTRLARFDLEQCLSEDLYLDVQVVNAALTNLTRNGWTVQYSQVNPLEKGAVAAHVDRGHIFLVGRLESIVFVYNTYDKHTSYATVLKPLLVSEVAKVYLIRAHRQPGTNSCGLTTVNGANQIMESSPLDRNWKTILGILEGLQPSIPDLKRHLLSVLLPGTGKVLPVPNRRGPNKRIYSYAIQRDQKKTRELSVSLKSGDEPAVHSWCICGYDTTGLSLPQCSEQVPPLHCRSCSKPIVCQHCSTSVTLASFTEYLSVEVPQDAPKAAFQCPSCACEFDQCDCCMVPVCCTDCMQDLPYRRDDYYNPRQTCKGCLVSHELCPACRCFIHKNSGEGWDRYIRVNRSPKNHGLSLRRECEREDQILMYTTFSLIPSRLALQNFCKDLEGTGMYVFTDITIDKLADDLPFELVDDRYHEQKTGASFKQIRHATPALKEFSLLAGSLLAAVSALRQLFGTAWETNPTTLSVFNPGPLAHVQFPGPAFWLCYALEPGTYSTVSPDLKSLKPGAPNKPGALTSCGPTSLSTSSHTDIRKLVVQAPHLDTRVRLEMKSHQFFVCAASAPFQWHTGGKRLQMAMAPQSKSSIQDLLYAPGKPKANCLPLSIIPIDKVEVFTDVSDQRTCPECLQLCPVYVGNVVSCAGCSRNVKRTRQQTQCAAQKAQRKQ